MDKVGDMHMPGDFRHRDAFDRGRPEHDPYDPFSIRHPRMDVGHRAKIFAPFDALRGFGEAVASKDILYEDFAQPEQDDMDELNRTAYRIRELIPDSRAAQRLQLQVAVTYFEPCRDVTNEAYAVRGQYRSIRGVCMGIDAEVSGTVTVDGERIELADIVRLVICGDDADEI